MKRTLLATTAALSMVIAVGPALAGNIDEPILTPAPAMPMPAPVPVRTDGDWGGFYGGGSLGFANVDDDAGTFGDDFDGLTYGAHVGYDYDFGSFILGGELEISGFDVSDDTTGTDVDSVTRLKVRAGYDAGLFLPYAVAGMAQLNTSGTTLGDADDTGGFYGIGLDYKLTDSIRVGGEVLQHEFDDFDGSGIDADALTAGMRVSFEF